SRSPRWPAPRSSSISPASPRSTPTISRSPAPSSRCAADAAHRPRTGALLDELGERVLELLVLAVGVAGFEALADEADDALGIADEGRRHVVGAVVAGDAGLVGRH